MSRYHCGHLHWLGLIIVLALYARHEDVAIQLRLRMEKSTWGT